VAQIPSFAGSGQPSETALIFNPGGFEAGGPSSGLYANKYMPSFSDIVAKVWGSHTVKAGFFYEWIRNAQPANGNTNGYLQTNYTNPYSSGSSYADLLLGILSSYNEQSFNRINDIAYNTYEGFVQDSWKVTRQLSLDFGVRITHFQPWIDREGFGFSIFDYSKYNASCKPSDYCGFLWNARDPSVPLGGFPTRTAFWQPRLGFAYDILGKGQTVLRGGWGRFYYHAGQFTAGLDVSAGVQTINLGNNVAGVPLRASQLDTLAFTSEALTPAAVDSEADQQPYTDSYSFTVAQRTPWSGLLELAYVGNRSRDIPSQGNGGSLGFNTMNINLVPVGAMLASANGGADPNTLTADNFRPLRGFSNLNLATFNGYSNYNSLQVTWQRSKGRYNVNLNYTFGKAMGLINFDDQFNLDNNYGVLPSNRTHLFNIAYSFELGNPVKSKVGGAFLNGWQISGINQIQSGSELWSNSDNRNFGMNLNNAKVPGTDHNISNASLLGTPNLQLRPLVTCDPRENLGTNQYVNGSCFAMPSSIGANGPTVLPPIYGPAFFNWDLGLFKNFSISEAKKLQFRFDGYNFLNHPLYSFPGGNNLSLIFNPATGQLDNPNFGYATEKEGRRIIQMSVKFIF
jgi:hypothetical protein